MPYKPRTTKRPYRKAARKPLAKTRRRKKLGYATNISKSQRVCCKYTEPINVQLQLSNAYTWGYTFRPNCSYDPNFSGGGHQSMFRDQWFQLYEFTRCVKFMFKLVIFTDSDSPIDVVMVPTTTSSPIAFEQATETKGARVRTIQKYKPLTLKISSYVDRFMGNKKGTCLSDDAFKQGNSALSDKASCWIQLAAISRTSTTSNIWARVYLCQYLSFVEPIYQNQS